MPLHLAYRPDRLVARAVFRPACHAAEQLVEHRERGVSQAFLKADGCGRECRMTALWTEFAQMLWRDPHRLVGQPVKGRRWDHGGASGIDAERPDMIEPSIGIAGLLGPA